jgi:hypothetical protein
MKPARRITLFQEIVAALFVLLFLYTAIEKLRERYEFEGMMRFSPLISTFAQILSWAVPLTELAIVLLLFFRKTRRVGLLASTILMTLFTGYIIYIMTFAEKLPCSCGGVIQMLGWKEHLLFNLFFLLLGIASLISFKYNRSIAINRSSRIPV